MGVQTGQPRVGRERLHDPLPCAGIPQRHAELGGGRRRAHRADGAAADLGVDPESDGGPRVRRPQRGDPVHLVEVVGVESHPEGQRPADLVTRLGGGVEDDLRRREPGVERDPQLARARDLAAHAALREQPQYGHERRGLRGEGMEHARHPRERLMEGGDRVADPVGVDESDDRAGLAEQALGDGVADRGRDTGGRGRGAGERGKAHGIRVGDGRPTVSVRQDSIGAGPCPDGQRTVRTTANLSAVP